MRVLLITTHLRPGGVPFYTVSLANGLDKNGIPVSVVSSGGDFEGKLAPQVKHRKLNISTKCEFGLKVFAALPKLTRIVRDERIDILHAQTRVAQVLGGIVSRITSVPMVTTAHGYYSPHRISRRTFPLWGDGVIAVSDAVGRHLTEDFKVPPEMVRRVYNGIELELYRSGGDEAGDKMRDELGISDKAIVIGSVGRLSDVKGFEYLVEACGILKSKGHAVTVLIAGEGKERKTLLDRARSCGIEKEFHLIKPSSVRGCFFAMDIFCMPSLSEGLGLSLMEAMAAGRACVASDIGGLKELIIEGKTGLLASPGSSASVARALEALISSGDLRAFLGANARERAFTEFGIERCIEQTAGFYEQVLKSRKASYVRK